MSTNRKLSDEEKAARKLARKKTSKAFMRKVATSVARTHREELLRLESGRKHPRRKHDWDMIRDYYITAREQLTFNQVAEQFEVSPQMVKTRAQRERWTHLRGIEQARVFRIVREQRYKDNYEEGVKFDKMSVDIAKMGLGIVAGRLGQMARFFRASEPAHNEMFERLERGEPVTLKELKAIGVDSYELLRLAQAATMFQDVGRKALGTDVENINLNVDGAVEVEHVVNIGAELAKGDSDRLTGVVNVLERIGLVNVKELEAGQDDVYDAEIVDEEEDE